MSLKSFIRNRLEPGSHICLLYASESEHIEAISTFFQQAIADGARIFYTCSQHTPQSLQNELLQVGIDLRPLIERGQVTLLDTRQVALPVDPLAAPLMRAEMLQQARQAGYSAVYLSTEIPFNSEHNLDQLLPDLEMELISDQASLPAVYLCQYDRRSFSPQALTDALVTHPLVMVDGEILENHFYIAPEALSKHSPGASRFEFLLNQLLDHQKMEKRIRRTEQMYESVATASPDGILLLTPDAFIRFASPKALTLFGYQRLEQLFGSSIWELFAPEDLPRAAAHFHSTSPRPPGEENLYHMQRNDGSGFIGELDLAAFWDDDGQLEGSVGIIRDVTEQEKSREALYNSEQSAVALLDALSDVAILIDLEGKILAINRPGAQQLCGEPELMLGKNLFETLTPLSGDAVKRWIEQMQAGQAVYRESFQLENRDYDLTIQPVRDARGKLVRAAMVYRDVTQFKQAEADERERRQIAESLRTTSEALTLAFTAEAVYATIIASIQRLIPDVLTYLLLIEDHHSGQLRFFPPSPSAIHNGGSATPLNSNSTPGLRQMVDTHGLLMIPDVLADPLWVSTESPTWTRSFAGIPIIIENQVAGFVCLHSNQVNYFQPNHLQVLESFAGQAAIALQKARTFTALEEKNLEIRAANSALAEKNAALAAAYTELEDKNQAIAAAYFELENKNQALAAAYQATIEGWSRALELRDKETQGHSQRVVALTVKLAERLRVAPGELIYIRWGALLHDIGKMGIPDAILLKPSSLSDDDWVTMKKHPELAFKWLSGIAYLEPALDIPHYHHEHWDGSGYPCGLRAAAIPLPARIFAVIDNWDALLANRPYRPAWPRAKVVNYLRAQSGRKFDPSIVDVFLDMIKEG